jgi:hypothetical protein
MPVLPSPRVAAWIFSIVAISSAAWASERVGNWSIKASQRSRKRVKADFSIGSVEVRVARSHSATFSSGSIRSDMGSPQGRRSLGKLFHQPVTPYVKRHRCGNIGHFILVNQDNYYCPCQLVPADAGMSGLTGCFAGHDSAGGSDRR